MWPSPGFHGTENGTDRSSYCRLGSPIAIYLLETLHFVRCTVNEIKKGAPNLEFRNLFRFYWPDRQQINSTQALTLYPTSPFAILKLQNPSHDVPELRQFAARSPDLEARKNCEKVRRVAAQPDRTFIIFWNTKSGEGRTFYVWGNVDFWILYLTSDEEMSGREGNE